MILVLGHCVRKVDTSSSKDSEIDKLLSTNAENRNLTIKMILKIFSAIGYTNLWADSYNNLKGL